MSIYIEIAGFVIAGMWLGIVVHALYEWKYPAPRIRAPELYRHAIGLYRSGKCDCCGHDSQERVVWTDRMLLCDLCSRERNANGIEL